MSAFQEDTLWTGSGSNPCNGNSQGDPVVLYDRLADRWILTHFAFGFGPFGPISPFYQCIAVSKSGDPVSGGWWLYPLRLDPGGAGLPPVGAFNDYAKLGVWHDCLYLAANEFDESGSPPTENFLGVAFASFSRADMYSGAPLTWALGYMPYPANDVFTLIPSHNLATTPNAPSPGTPSYFVNESTQFFQFIVRKFTAGANCGAGGTMGAPVGVSQTAYNYNVLEDIPQPNTTNTLDSLVDRLMQKVIYRKVNNVESVWVTHTVGDGDPTDNNPPLTKTGMQWAQINVTGGTVATTPVQQGIHWPDALWRFMGSVAVDGQGNMALGYSTSGPNAPDFPSIKYAGRLATDPLNTLPQTEQVLIAGGGSQTNTCGPGPCHRWGDYSAMSVDPIDDCTFWYINEYYDTQASGTSGNWHTRIGSFKFPTCTSPINGAARTFVSATSAGVDTNPCTTAAPCRTLAHALTLTTPGGEIQVLDSGGYGGLTIDRPITIAASEGVYAGVVGHGALRRKLRHQQLRRGYPCDASGHVDAVRAWLLAARQCDGHLGRHDSEWLARTRDRQRHVRQEHERRIADLAARRNRNRAQQHVHQRWQWHRHRTIVRQHRQARDTQVDLRRQQRGRTVGRKHRSYRDGECGIVHVLEQQRRRDYCRQQRRRARGRQHGHPQPARRFSRLGGNDRVVRQQSRAQQHDQRQLLVDHFPAVAPQRRIT